MSRAFVKEPDGDQVESDLPERPQSKHPNYITTDGLQSMKLAVEAMRQERDRLKKEDDLSAKNQIKAVEAGDFARYTDHLSNNEQMLQAGYILHMTKLNIHMQRRGDR